MFITLLDQDRHMFVALFPSLTKRRQSARLPAARTSIRNDIFLSFVTFLHQLRSVLCSTTLQPNSRIITDGSRNLEMVGHVEVVDEDLEAISDLNEGVGMNATIIRDNTT